MSDLETVRGLARGALASLELSRERIDDLNVYPVPDGDTGTNLTLTVRGIVEALDASSAGDRPALAHEVTRAALMSARGNSGVILSQIVRGAADVLAAAGEVDSEVIARAFRGASDEAYRAVRSPIEGTMLTVVRELAEAAVAEPGPTPADLLATLVERGEQAVERTPEQLDVLREAGVVDAGAAGLVELVRGLAAAVAGEAVAEPAAQRYSSLEHAVHQELSRYRYCTTFVLEGDGLDAEGLEAELEQLGDSLLVVGDPAALKVHVHTDDPGAALSLGTRAGTIEGVEIADMHRQTEQREDRLLAAVPSGARSGVVAVVAGEGNRRLFEDVGAEAIVEGGQTMNPSTADLLAAIEGVAAGEVVLLPNNSNVVLAAEQAARVAGRPVQVVATESIPAGLAALVAFHRERSAEENATAMRDALTGLATGEVAIASRDASADGVSVHEGEYLALLDGLAIASGPAFDEVAAALLERLLAEPRDVLTVLRGEGAPPLNGLLEELAARYPELELDVHEGGQPNYPLLLSAE
jgi:DAK2 domain fusion protein YloV